MEKPETDRAPGRRVLIARQEAELVLGAAERLVETVLETRSGVSIDADPGLRFDVQSAQAAFEALERAMQVGLSARTRQALEHASGLPLELLVQQSVRDWLYSPSRLLLDLAARRRFTPQAFIEELTGRLRARGHDLVVQGADEASIVSAERRFTRVPILAVLGGSLGYLIGLSLLVLDWGPRSADPVGLSTFAGALLGIALGLYWTLTEPRWRCSECGFATRPAAAACAACEARLITGGPSG